MLHYCPFAGPWVYMKKATLHVLVSFSHGRPLIAFRDSCILVLGYLAIWTTRRRASP